ncbi:hypothetical protein V6N13_125374 [Hibiscus sabdariffa]|uniref:Uncharacterized protein n=1 Tax=Hibiscus sabdariffa TaxID=183260 RepID=A0ABR2U5E2_9ROSI
MKVMKTQDGNLKRLGWLPVSSILGSEAINKRKSFFNPNTVRILTQSLNRKCMRRGVSLSSSKGKTTSSKEHNHILNVSNDRTNLRPVKIMRV